MVGDHIIFAPDPSGGGDILSLCQHELGVGHTAVAGEAGDEFTAVCLLWICHIVDDVADGAAFRAAFATCSGMMRVVAMKTPPFSKRKRPAFTDRLVLFCSIILIQKELGSSSKSSGSCWKESAFPTALAPAPEHPGVYPSLCFSARTVAPLISARAD